MSAESNSEPNEFPESILLKDLQAVHSEYKAEKIADYEALYEGGEKFDLRKERFLVKLQMEEPQTKNPQGLNPKAEGNIHTDAPKLQNAGEAGAHYKSRKKRAWYKPVVSGLLDFMCAAVMQNPPCVAVSQPEKKATGLADRVKAAWLRLIGSKDAEDPSSAYWHDLNRDVDGLGTDFAANAWQALIESMVQKRSYFVVEFPKVDADNLAEQKDEGAFDCTVVRLGAKDVDDWQTDAKGALTMVRVHTEEAVRSSPFAQPDRKKHTWTFFTKAAVYQYVLEYDAKEEPNPESTQVSRTVADSHDLGRLPVVPIRSNLWPMDRLADAVIELFNRETATAHYLDKIAYAMLVLYTEKDLGQVVTDQALVLNPTDKAEIVAAKAEVYTALKADIERLYECLFLLIQAMVLLAASKDDQGRQSGVSKQRDFGSLSTLLAAFASPLKDALEEVVKIIKEARGDDSIVLAIQGLDNFDVQSLELKIKNTASLLNLPMPPAARNWAILDTALAACANAPSEVREQIVQDIMDGKVEDAAKVAAPETRAPNTQQVKPVEKKVA